MPTPYLIIVAGPPAAGKSTLARQLATAIPCPSISRDALREGMMTTYPHPVSHATVNTAFASVVATTLRHGITCVVEAAFQHPLWQQLIMQWAVPYVVIACHVDQATAIARMRQRLATHPARHTVHQDQEFLVRLETMQWRVDDFQYPNGSVPRYHIDTTKSVDVDALVVWVHASREQGKPYNRDA